MKKYFIFVLFCSLCIACNPAINIDPYVSAENEQPTITLSRASGVPSLNQNQIPLVPHSFIEAKRKLMTEIYLESENRFDIYCHCPFNQEREVNLLACNYQPNEREANRAEKIEWDHVVPASRFGRSLPCWQTRSDRHHSHRRTCQETDSNFRMMEGDMHNLMPAVGQINALRSNYNLNEIDGENHINTCDFEVESSNVEPREAVRGDLARAYLYFHITYHLPLTEEEKQLYLRWHQNDPPDTWERERNRRIALIQGNSNPFIMNPSMTLENFIEP